MYVSARITRNSLLCGIIFASACLISIAHADRSVMYTVPYKGSVYGVVPKNAAAAEAMEQWSVNSRKVRTTGYGAAASATASRSSYGFVGRMTVSRAFFQAWLAYEIGSIGLEWIASQYKKPSEAYELTKDLNWVLKESIREKICVEANCFCIESGGCFNSNAAAIEEMLNMGYIGCRTGWPSANATIAVKTIDTAYNQCAKVNYQCINGNNYGALSSHSLACFQASKSIDTGKYITNLGEHSKLPVGEPTIDPDPYLTASILDQWAHIVPEMRQRVSDTVDFVPNPARYTEKDVLGNVLKDYEGVLEPMEEPIANPHKTAKRPAPDIEPTPRLKTTDLLKGNEIIQPTEPIKEPASETTTQTVPKVDVNVDVDLSKIEDAVTNIGADPADTAIPELELGEWGEIEIPTPEATDDQIAEQAGKIRKTVTEQQIIQKAEELIGMHAFNFETFGNSSACPKPRKMRFLTVEFDLPFDMYCDYIKQIVMLMIGLIPLGVFIYFLKNLFIHG